MPFGQPALALAAQLQRRAARAGVPEDLARLDGAPLDGQRGGPVTAEPAAAPQGKTGAEIGRELFRLVGQARAAGVDPEMELRTAARRYLEAVRRWEQAAGSS